MIHKTEKRLLWFLSLFLVFILSACICAGSTYAAAAPKFNVTKKEITGKNKTYKLTIKNKPKKAKYKWTTSNKKVATVKNGTVTSKTKGTAAIKCKITYSNKKSKTLSCKVTVTVPATEIHISNIKSGENGTHCIQIGKSYDFNKTFTPSDSSYKAYWTVTTVKEEGDTSVEPAASVDDKGVVTGLRTGKTVILKVTAAKNKEAAKTSKIDDSIILSIVGKSSSVSSVAGTTNAIQIQFEEAIDSKTVIESGNILKNISLSMMQDNEDKWAQAPGKLTAQLSPDKKTLTITPANILGGRYKLTVPPSVLTVSGLPVERYSEELNFENNDSPYITEIDNDSSGYIANIHFSKPVNTNRMKISSVSAVGSVLDKLTVNILSAPGNYVLSQDKRTLSINLSAVSAGDKNKTYLVAFTGIVDMDGNPPKEEPLIATLRIDTQTRPQAKVLTVERTALDEITVTFDSSIEKAGYLLIAGTMYTGTINSTNDKIVSYKLTQSGVNLSGMQSISIIGFSGYHVAGAYGNETRTVDLSYTKEPPKCIDYKYSSGQSGNNLYLTFDRNVKVQSTGGMLMANITDASGNVYPKTVKYLAVSQNATTVSITLLSDSLTIKGNYELHIPAGMVTDYSGNPCEMINISIPVA